MKKPTSEEEYLQVVDWMLATRKELAEIRASLTALKTFVARQIAQPPATAEEVVRQIENLEREALANDPAPKELQQAADASDAIRLWKKRGGSGGLDS